MKLYDHQQKIIDDDPKKCGLWLGTGSGKTRTALLLARGRTLVIAPKTQVEDRNWERELKELMRIEAFEKGTSVRRALVVISKETFRRDHATLPIFDTVIIDEAHTVLGVTPNTCQRKRVQYPKASQVFEAVEDFIRRTKPTRLYLCTATIVKSPLTVWAARWLLGKIKGDKMKSYLFFRNSFYTRLPMPGREVYSPKRDSKTKDLLATLVRDCGYVGRLEDYFDVPEQTFKTEYVDLTAPQQKRLKSLAIQFPDPIVLIGKRHQLENGILSGDEYNSAEYFPNAKLEKILEYADEFPRMIIFAKYRGQIREIENVLRKAKKRTYTLTGDTKDRGSLISEVKKRLNYVLICQAQISAGWEVPECPVMIFASCTYSFVDRVQAEGRILRANALKKNLYIDLVVKGGIDEAVQNAITNKKDFDERIYLDI